MTRPLPGAARPAASGGIVGESPDARAAVRRDPGGMKTILTLTLACALLLGGATADAATYAGRTAGGTTIRFKLDGKRIRALSTTVPTVCLETSGSGMTRAGAELFQPPGSFALGRTGKARALQPAAMNQGIRATKNYTVTTKAAGAGKVSGALELSFSYLRPGIDIYRSYTYVCSGKTRFTATAR
jgi:hypothetical protein